MSLISAPQDLAGVRAAARATVEALDYASAYIRPGITTEEINTLCHAHMTEIQGVVPASLHYQGFPKSVCISVNNVVCHGIPDARVLTSGDIVNLDLALIKDGYFGDCSRNFLVGKVSAFAKRLSEVTREAMYCGIRAVRPGNRLGDIGAAIQTCAEAARFSVVRDYCGHGVGLEFHDEPQVLHYGKPGEGSELKEGMCFTIEPMINAGSSEVRVLKDGWTVVTSDGKLSAQWEHMVLVTKGGYEVLTLAEDEIIE